MAAPMRALLLVVLLAAACRGQDRGAADLQGMADSLLPRLEVLSGLEANQPVRLARQDREAMRAYVTRRLDEELPPEELEGMRATYAALGLIPETLDLRSLLLDLYTEQVVGYYDPETKALYVIEGAPADELRPILAHELVHALQDQHTDLDSLISRERGNDRQTAAQAAIEGHATLVMFMLMLEEQVGEALPVAQLPDMTAQLGPIVEAQNSEYPVFRSAPRIIRETLLFPYVRGAAFVQQLWRAGGGTAANGGIEFPAPIDSLLPASTEQVLHARDRFFTRRDAPTQVVLAATEDGASVVYENSLGELETSILLEEHLGREARTLAEGWDGDHYRLLRPASGGTALVWYSVWDDPAAADVFATAYRRILEQRPDRHGRVERLEVEGRPVVRVLDADRETALDEVPVPAIERLVEG